MTLLIARCSVHAFLISATRVAPSPLTWPRRSGSRSSTVRVSIPNCATMRFAKPGPMPGIKPEPRYFSMPESVLGWSGTSETARNCRPCRGSSKNSPVTRTRVPGPTAWNFPITDSGPVVPRSPCTDPTRSTRKPVSSFS